MIYYNVKHALLCVASVTVEYDWWYGILGQQIDLVENELPKSSCHQMALSQIKSHISPPP